MFVVLLLPSILFASGVVDSIKGGVTNFSIQAQAAAIKDTALYLIYFDSDETANRAELLVSYDYGVTWQVTDNTPFGTAATFQSDEPSLWVLNNDTLYGLNNDAGGTIITKFVGDTSLVVNTPSPPTIAGTPSFAGANMRNDSMIFACDVGTGFLWSGFITDGSWGAAATWIGTSDSVGGSVSGTSPFPFAVGGGVGVVGSSTTGGNNRFFFTDGYTNTMSHVSNTPWQPASFLQVCAIAKDPMNDTLYIAMYVNDSILILGGYLNASDSLVLTDSVYVDVDAPTTPSGEFQYPDPQLTIYQGGLYLVAKNWPDPSNNDSIEVRHWAAINSELGSLAFSGSSTLLHPASGVDSIGSLHAAPRIPDQYDIDAMFVAWHNAAAEGARELSIAVDTLSAATASAVKGHHKGVYLKKGKF